MGTVLHGLFLKFLACHFPRKYGMCLTSRQKHPENLHFLFHESYGKSIVEKMFSVAAFHLNFFELCQLTHFKRDPLLQIRFLCGFLFLFIREDQPRHLMKIVLVFCCRKSQKKIPKLKVSLLLNLIIKHIFIRSANASHLPCGLWL